MRYGVSCMDADCNELMYQEFGTYYAALKCFTDMVLAYRYDYVYLFDKQQADFTKRVACRFALNEISLED